MRDSELPVAPASIFEKGVAISDRASGKVARDGNTDLCRQICLRPGRICSEAAIWHSFWEIHCGRMTARGP